MPQLDAWEKEYRNPQLVAVGDDPQRSVLKYLKWLRRKEKKDLPGLAVLDLGSGIGKNANFMAKEGATVTGIELSPTAVAIAKQRAAEEGVTVTYLQRSFGEVFPLGDVSIDLVLDVMASNSLNEQERAIYLQEMHRVLKPGGHALVRGLCKDGDKNTKALLAKFPGEEYDTYRNPDMNLVERVFSEEDFRKTYNPLFEILSLEKKSNYARFNGRVYKRNYWMASLRKAANECCDLGSNNPTLST
jgi:SAM-dependent methyltransferase